LQVYNGTTWTNWCGGAASSALPTIITAAVSSIGAYTATGGGDITSDGGSSIIARGICWSTSPNPTVSDPRTNDGTGSGSYVSSLTGLLPLTTYYVRAFAANSTGLAYGNQVSFTTTATIPTLTTTAASSITGTTASSGGNITLDGGSAVTARGVCWSTSSSPTILNSKTIDGSGTGSFTSSITGLAAGTLYYVRAYATNGIGTAYGNEISFTTVALPTVTTRTPDNISGTAARSGGDVTSDGGGSITAKGVCWNTSANPTTANSKTDEGAGAGAYLSNLTGLTLGNIYHIRAYATNSAGTSYGSDISFIALAIGDSWGGGKVAYIDGTNLIHGFIAATSDQSAGAVWGCSGTDLAGAGGTAIGTGNQNTTEIDAGCTTGGIAADICINLVTGGQNDWYLPSSDELWQLYFNRVAIGGFVAGGFYWSSSEISTLNANRVRFDSGTITSVAKTGSLNVRAIRSF
jgi:hypothetical protein